MSEVVLLTSGESETVYGTFAASKAYLGIMLGARYDAWRGLGDDDKKRALATARRYLDRYTWISSADTFAKRDALTDFVNASYELAAIASEDPGVLSQGAQGDNVQSVSGGGVSVSLFSPSASTGKLPDVVLQMLGKYLATVAVAGGYGVTGDEVSAFDDDSDYDRSEPY